MNRLTIHDVNKIKVTNEKHTLDSGRVFYTKTIEIFDEKGDEMFSVKCFNDKKIGGK